MQPLPFLALIPLLTILPIVACIVGAALNVRRNPALSGTLAVVAALLAAMAVIMLRSIVLSG